MFQSQFQSNLPGKNSLKRYLLKLLIKKRLEEIRKNSTNGAETTTNKLGLLTSPSDFESSPVTPLSSTTPTTPSTTITTTTTTTTILCPEIYMKDPASTLLCQLWEELQNLISDNNNNGLFIGKSPELILCQFRDHETSAFLLCQLWCEIKSFSNKVLVNYQQNFLFELIGKKSFLEMC